jgi:hypothetical protein
MFTPSKLIVALALTLSGMTIAMAQPVDRGSTPGLGYGKGGKPQVGAPGPVAGVGLPLLVVAGGLFWVRSRKRQANTAKGE